jgi:tetratricopeptide (TPR) repeat protein
VAWLLAVFRKLPVWAEVCVALLLLGAALFLVLRLTGDRVPMRVRCFEAGVAAYDARRFDESARWMRAVLSEDPRHAFARYILGRSLCETGSRQEGVSEVRRSFESAPGNPDAAVFLAEIAVAEGREPDAIGLLRRCGQHRPLRADARMLIAGIALRQGLVSTAIGELRAVVSEARSHRPVQAALLLADLFDRRASATGSGSDRAEARRLFSRVLEWSLEPGAKVREEDLATACFGLRRTEEAVAHADRAARTAGSGDSKELALLRARVFLDRKDFPAADAELARVLAPGAESTDFLDVAEILARAGRDDARLRTLEEARGRMPADERILLEWAEARAGAGQGGDVIDALRTEGAKSPDCVLLAVRLERGRGRVTEARALLREAEVAFPDDRRIRAEALSSRLEGLEDGPPGLDRDAVARLGEEIRRFVEEAGELSEPCAQILLGRLLLLEGQQREGVERLLAARIEAPFDRRISFDAALALMRAGLDEEVIATLDRRETPGTGRAPESDLILAESLLRLRRFARAGAILREVLGGSPDNHAARRLLARVFLSDGRLDAAHAEYARLAEDLPGDFEVAAMEGYLSLVTRRSSDPEAAFARAKGILRNPDDLIEIVRLTALHLWKAGRLEDADAVYRTLLLDRPGDSRAVLSRARFLVSAGRIAEARTLLEQAVSGTAGDPEARRLLGELILLSGGESGEVIRQIDAIERTSPGHPDADYLRGRLALVAGDLTSATAGFSRALASRPFDPAALHALGLAHLRAGRPEEASRHLLMARSLDPESDPVRLALARALSATAAERFARGEVKEARDLLRKSLDAEPGNPEVSRLLASSLAVLGDLAEAERECEALLRRDPRDLGVLRLMAALRAKRGDLPGAAEVCRAACGLSECPEFDYLLLSWIELRAGRAEAAVAAAQKALGDGEPSPHAIEVLVLGLVAAGRAPEAETFLLERTAKAPGEALPFALLGLVLSGRGDVEGAIAAYESAVDRDPEMIAAFRNLLALELDARGFEAALDRVTERLSLAPDSAPLNYLAGWIFARMVKREEAAVFLRRALEADPTHRSAALLLATLRLELGDPAGARAAVEPLLESETGDADALLVAAHCLDLEGKTAEAVLICREAFAAASESPAAMNNLAMLLLRTPTSRAEAQDLVERALRLEPDNPDFHDSLGQVRAATGDHEGARESFRKAVAGFTDLLPGCEAATRAGGKGGQPERARETARVLAGRIAECRARLAAAEQKIRED